MRDFFTSLISMPALDQIVFYSCLVLFLWGGTNKFGRKLEFNDDFTSLDAMKSLRGFAAIGVLLHHISQEDLFQAKSVLSPFVNAGAYFVAIFFFCSGYGLIKSLDTKKDYLKGFNDPVPDKALEVILLGVKALYKAVARAEKEDRDKVCASVYEHGHDVLRLENVFL